MQGGYPNPIYPPVYAPSSPGYPIQNGMEIHMQPVQGAPPMQSVYQPVTVGSDGPASMAVPEAKSKQEVEDVMQAKPGIFTNERGNLKFVALVGRCPCCSLLIVYAVCFVLTAILLQGLASAARTDGFAGIITSVAQYQITDDRSIKMDSLQLAHEDIGTDLSMWKLFDENRDDCWSNAEFDKMCVPPCDLKFIDVSTAAVKDSKCGSDQISPDDFAEKAEDLQAFYKGLERPMTQMAGIFYIMYETKKKADYTIFNSEVAKKIKEVEDIAVQDKDFGKWCMRSDNVAYECTNAKFSPIRFLYASEFNVDAAKDVIKKLKDETKDANDMTLFDAHKRMGPCYDFGVPAKQADAVCDSACLAPKMKCAVTPDSKAKSLALSAELKAITGKWDGKAAAPLSDEQYQVMAEFVAWMKQLPSQAMLVDFHLDSAFNTTNTKNKFSRSIISFGGPIGDEVDGKRKYRNTQHKRKEQGDQLKKFVLDNLNKNFLDAAKGSFSEYVQVYYFMTALIFDVFIQILLQDALLAVFSIVCVFIYIWAVTGSVFLAIVGMSEILLSIPVAWFIVRLICQVKYFPGLNFLAIFIVCAIGADDIFVFMDAYVQSAYEGPSVLRDMETRFSWVYRKSGISMFLTSFTTCLSFLCCFTSPLPDTQAFGLFALWVIAFDYILVMTMYCTAVMVYHNRFERPPMCGCPCPTPVGWCTCGCCVENCDCALQNPTQKALEASKPGGAGVEQDLISQFFRTKFAAMINNWKARCVIAVIAIGWLIPAVIFTARLKPTNKPEQFLNENHPFQKAITTLNNFGANSQDAGIDIYYIWGLDNVDRAGVNLLMDSKNLGKVKYNDNFKFTASCQDKILQVCTDLKVSNTTEEVGPGAGPKVQYLDIIQRNKNAQGSIKCFVMDLLDDTVFRKPTGYNREEPATWVPAFLETKRKEFDDEDLSRVVPMRDIYNSGGSSRIGWNKNSQQLKFVVISVEAKKITQWDQPSEEFMMTQYNAYEQLRKNIKHKIGDSCGVSPQGVPVDVFMTDRYDGMGKGGSKFVFMHTQNVYSSSSLSGALAGVGIAFGVLILCTWDMAHPWDGVIISVFATLNILCTLISVLGLLTMAGWSLGSIEAILITILAGFSVDYVTHLGHAYSHNYGTKEERIVLTFAEMGGPVIHGMGTSVLASIPLLFCNLQYFIKFGTFFILTIAFSWLWANFAFMSVMATIGHAKQKDGASRSANGEPSPSSDGLPGRDLPAAEMHVYRGSA